MILSRTVGSFLRFKYKLFRKRPAVNICEQLAKTNSVLIFMPTKVEQFGAALRSLESLRKLRPKWKITVVTKLEMVSFIDSKLKVDILPYSKGDQNFAGVPKSAIKQLVRNTNYDLALDFKIKFDLLSVMLFELSGAPIKVCFGSPEKSPFYNFEIRVNPAESLPNKYNAMIKYITAMIGSETPQKTLPQT